VATLLAPTCITEDVLAAVGVAFATGELAAFGRSGRASIAADNIVFIELAEDCSVVAALLVNCAMKASLAETEPAATVSHVIVRYVTVPIARRMRTPSIDAR
jgi:hypothetical protein